MSQPLLVVVGATGNQGASVVACFLPFSSWRIRAITRNPSSAKAQALAAKGCEVVKADTGDVASLEKAFAGATVIFSVTDYWAPFWDDEAKRKLKPGQSIRVFCHDEEIRHGTNMAKAAMNTLHTLTHYIWSCTSSPRKWSKGKYNEIYHFESKATITDYVKKELPELAAKMSTIQVSFYASNVYTFASMRPQKQSDGSFAIERLTTPDKLHPFIATLWDTGPFVKAMTEMKPGKTVLAYTAMISFAQMAAMWARVTGQKCHYRQCTLRELQEQFPDEGEEGTMSDMYSHDFGYDGGDPESLGPKDLEIGERPDVIERWIGQSDWDAVMGPSWKAS